MSLPSLAPDELHYLQTTQSRIDEKFAPPEAWIA